MGPNQPSPDQDQPTPPSHAGSAPSIDELLERAARGQPGAASELLPLVYDHLRSLARSKMANEAPGQSLPPTALVHEAYLKLVGSDRPWNDKRHFLAAAALAMRRILVDRARAKKGPKRGVAGRQVSLELAEGSPDVLGRPENLSLDEQESDWLALENAMQALEAHDPALAEIVHLRYFAGLTVEEAAMALGVSARTINREWLVARAWLLRRMRVVAG